jgi:hypothetical protein
MISVIMFLSLLSASGCQGAETLPAVPGGTAKSIDVRAVLQIAASGESSAKEQLEAIAETAPRTVSGALAAAILMRWDDTLSTYTSNDAVFLPYQPRAPSMKVFALVQVDVDEAGTAQSVSVLKIDQPEHQVAVERFFLNRTYLPARHDGAYVASKAVVSVKPEVR